MDQPSSAPVLRIVRGTPTTAEIAAVTAVLLSLPTATVETTGPGSETGRWGDPAAALQQRRLGPGAWRASSR